MNVKQYAQARGITERRVRALIERGAIPATKHGKTWHIDDGAASHRTPARRPLSPQSRAALSRALKERSIAPLDGQMRARTAERIAALRAAENPAELITDWWGGIAPEVTDAGSSLAARAIHGDTEGVKARIAHRAPEYLRNTEDLAAAVLTERRIRQLSLDELARNSQVTVGELRALERTGEFTSLPSLRRILEQLRIEPAALPAPKWVKP